MTSSDLPPLSRAPERSAPNTDNPQPAERLASVLARIDAAARACGRDPGSVHLLAVSKTFSAQDVLALVRCGQRAFGENYLQEALGKMQDCEDSRTATGDDRPDVRSDAGRPEDRLQWHFIGPIQSNKTRAIAQAFDWVHSVDRERVARRLAEQRPAHLPPLQVCIQVDVSGEATKSGCEPSEALALAQVVAGLPGMVLRGVMAIPAPSDDPAKQRAQFAKARAVFERLKQSGLAVDTLSMGMSADLEAAISEGATIVRVGSALFGWRAPKASPLEGGQPGT